MKKIILLLAILFLNFSHAQTSIVNTSALTSGTVTGNITQQDETVIHDAGATLTLSLAFPANPRNGQVFIFASSGGVTALSLSTTVGTISNAITTIAAGGNATYVYCSGNTKWYKIK